MVMESWSHFLLRSRVSSVEADVPNLLSEQNHCPLTRVKCGAEKVELGYKTNPHANWSWNGVSSGAPRQWIHRWPQRCQNRNRGCLEVTYRTGNTHSAKTDVEGLPCAGTSPLQLPTDSREGSINSLPESKGSHLSIAQWASAVRFSGKLPVDRPVSVANVRFCSFNPSGRSLIQFVANAASEVAD